MQDLEVINDVVTVRLVGRPMRLLGRDDKPGEPGEPCRFSLDARGELIYAYGSMTQPRHDVWSRMQTDWKFQLNAGTIAAVANTLRDARKAMTPPVKEPWPLQSEAFEILNTAERLGVSAKSAGIIADAITACSYAYWQQDQAREQTRAGRAVVTPAASADRALQKLLRHVARLDERDARLAGLEK